MEIAIQAYKKYDGGYIAQQRPIKQSIVEYYVDLSRRFFKPEIVYLIYDEGIKEFLKRTFENDKGVKPISLKDFQKMGADDIVIINMAYFYDFKKLKKLTLKILLRGIIGQYGILLLSIIKSQLVNGLQQSLKTPS